ncbi:AI-2E family transporter [Thalassotalea ponticola]|uniref:AI-2E family transporter n=1 Tax=Thalassotalea ponticola TaxID=1523392 RepID=UPI0025B6008C|nr:AI-2E family transporter [Thalassotalea ponticola]MDN3651266.1 AI-2E family transporter [Thalassotalea ponticola]
MSTSNYTGSARLLVILASLVVIMAGIKAASNILIPFLLSVFIAIMCNPLVERAAQYRIPKVVAIVLIIGLFVGSGMTLAGLIGNSLNELSALMPVYKAQLTTKFSGLIDKLADYNINISSSILMEYLNPSAAMGFAANMLSSFGGIMANMFLIIITVVFMLFEAPSIPRKLHLALKDPEMKIERIDRFLLSVNRYIAIKTWVSLLTGCLVSLMLWIAGLDFFILWGVLAFLFNYIPNIGSIIAAVPAVLLAFVQFDPTMALFIGAGYMAINTVIGNMVEPRFLGKGLGLSTLVVFLSLIFWGWLLGTVGMLLSVPLTMIIKIALETSEGGKWLSVMLGDAEEAAQRVPVSPAMESIDTKE